jgi:uncharacterized protein YdhG (YjbR/CyaY superfamily)
MRNGPKLPANATIDDYLKPLPVKIRTALEKLRKTIRSAVPEAQEVISYQIPIFKQHGPVAGFAAFANHCSYFTMSPAIVRAFKKELVDFKSSGSTIHFSPEKPLPAALVKKLVWAKLMENEEKLAAKKKK